MVNFDSGQNGNSSGDAKAEKRSGVSVEIFSAGDGVNYPRKGQTVTIHYTAYLADGTMFDSSRSRKRPMRFKLGCGYVIPGIDQGVAQLSVGERAKVIIPPHLAYESKGFPGLVPPDSTLIFDMELLTFH